MSPQESCRAAEEKIREIQKTMGPETMEQCIVDLGEVAVTLESLTRAEAHVDAESFLRVKQAAALLRAQAEHATNFWSGLLHMRIGAGYTNHGAPFYFATEAQSSFEG